jgi:hypothetical protein
LLRYPGPEVNDQLSRAGHQADHESRRAAYAAPVQTVPLIIEPDPDDPGCALSLLDGTVLGGPLRFVLDTGAVRTQIVADPGATRPCGGPTGCLTSRRGGGR